MSTQRIKILSLYPRELNMYGDTGNLLVLKKRAEWRNIAVEIVSFECGDELSLIKGTNLIIGGGGQDSGQAAAQTDLLRIAPLLTELIEDDVPALAVCGTFQLFGNCIMSSDGAVTEGIGILNMHTTSGEKREIGTIVTRNDVFGELIGYENHSGRTYLGKGLEPFAQVVSGFGNNGEDGTEGARYRNVIGTYLHGPLLPKNPQVADYLIACALSRHADEMIELSPLPDTWVEPARAVARNRLR